MPIHPDTLSEWNNKLKGDAIARQHTINHSKFEAADVLAAYRADLNKIRGGLGTPEDNNQGCRDGPKQFFDEFGTPDHIDEFG